MSKKVKTVVVVSGLKGESVYSLFCEPEGAEQEVRPGDQVTFTFTGPTPQAIEVSWTPKGLVLGRPLDADDEIRIVDRSGRQLRW